MITRRLTAEGLDDFIHQPLDIAVQSIRVLSILPGKRRSPVRCNLRHQILKDSYHYTRAYVCLSYMWGQESPLKTIIVNGNKLQIRLNLWRFLRSARRLNITWALWIDAICIDQRNTEERNHQVRLMTKIYQQARYVIVWPEPVFGGVQDKDTGDISSAFVKEKRTAAFERCTSRKWHDLALKVLPYPAGPYWNRLWILQELLLAKALYIVVGNSLLAWDDFDYLCTQKIANSMNGPSALLSDPLKDMLRQVAAKTILANDESIPTTLLIDALEVSRGRECADVRDRLYGILGMLDRKGIFPVDYTIPAATILLNVASDLAKAHTKLEDLFLGIKHLASAFELGCISICMECAYSKPQISKEGIPFGPWGQGHESPFLLLTLDKQDIPTWNPKEDSHFDVDRCAACRYGMRAEPLQMWTLMMSMETLRCTPKQLFCLPKFISVDDL